MLIVACGPKERSLNVTATAFNSTRAQTDHRPNEAACGDRLNAGDKVVAISRDLEEVGITCDTEISIAGLDGTYKVVDRMAARRKNHIDIYMGRDVKAAREWGKQDVVITWKEEKDEKP